VPEDDAPAATGPTVGADWGGEDVEGAVQALEAQAAEIASDGQDVGDGIRRATVRAPVGNPLGDRAPSGAADD
jgi:hypothetical protein